MRQQRACHLRARRAVGVDVGGVHAHAQLPSAQWHFDKLPITASATPWPWRRTDKALHTRTGGARQAGQQRSEALMPTSCSAMNSALCCANSRCRACATSPVTNSSPGRRLMRRPTSLRPGPGRRRGRCTICVLGVSRSSRVAWRARGGLRARRDALVSGQWFREIALVVRAVHGRYLGLGACCGRQRMIVRLCGRTESGPDGATFVAKSEWPSSVSERSSTMHEP